MGWVGRTAGRVRGVATQRHRGRRQAEAEPQAEGSVLVHGLVWTGGGLFARAPCTSHARWGAGLVNTLRLVLVVPPHRCAHLAAPHLVRVLHRAPSYDAVDVEVEALGQARKVVSQAPLVSDVVDVREVRWRRHLRRVVHVVRTRQHAAVT